MNIDQLIKKAIAETLSEKGINTQESHLYKTEANVENNTVLKEAYVAEAGKFNLNTELLSQKLKEHIKSYLKDMSKS